MVRLRLRRVGRKNQASFRIVAADKETKRDGRFLEVVGFYNPRTEPETIQLKEDLVYKWLKNGAQPSESAERIFKTAGVFERFERFKAGEDVEKLLKEAATAEEKRAAGNTTRVQPPVKSTKKKAEPEAAAKAEAPAAEAAVEETAVEEIAAKEAVVEAEVEEEAADAKDADAEEAPVEAADAKDVDAEETAAEEESPADEE
jgi:small subunit ribosomal protein S16